jgi:hypothetical protein
MHSRIKVQHRTLDPPSEGYGVASAQSCLMDEPFRGDSYFVASPLHSRGEDKGEGFQCRYCFV